MTLTDVPQRLHGISRFEHVLVIDDCYAWLDLVSYLFSKKISRLHTLLTADRHQALKQIRHLQPQAVMLDLNLTEAGQEGIWIAQRSRIEGYQGLILLTSSSEESDLERIRQQIKGPTLAPGKNTEKIWSYLCKPE